MGLHTVRDREQNPHQPQLRPAVLQWEIFGTTPLQMIYTDGPRMVLVVIGWISPAPLWPTCQLTW